MRLCDVIGVVVQIKSFSLSERCIDAASNGELFKAKATLANSIGTVPGSCVPGPMIRFLPKLKLSSVLRHHRSNLRLSTVSCLDAQFMYGIFSRFIFVREKSRMVSNARPASESNSLNAEL